MTIGVLKQTKKCGLSPRFGNILPAELLAKSYIGSAKPPFRAMIARFTRKSNRAGGIEGGISNGEPGDVLGRPPRNFLFLSDSTLTNNRAVGGAGSVGGLGRGGAIDNGENATATISGTLIGDNQTFGGSGTVTGGDGLGGGLYNEIRSDVTLCGCTVTGNQATGGNGPTAGRGIGGGVYNTPGGTVWVDALTLIFANDASTSEDDVFGILTFL